MKIIKTSQQGIEFIKSKEGFVATPTDDGFGNLTVGWGHKLMAEEKKQWLEILGGRYPANIAINGILSVLHGDARMVARDHAPEYFFHNEILRVDVETAERAVNSLVDQERFDLLQHEYDAIISLVFNIGQGAFADSNTLKIINQWHWGGCAEAGQELRQEWADGMHGFVKVNKVYSEGLFYRRRDELLVFFNGLYKM